jgi:hypothetical protein
LPASQSSQLLALALLACVPGSQFVHVDDRSADFLPGSQSLHDDAALPLHFPGPQSLHCSDDAVLCDPALQAVQVVAPLVTPVRKPAAHTRHSSSCALGAYLPLSHLVQLPLEEYSPSPHTTQLFRSSLGRAPAPQTAHSSRPKESL